MKRNLLRKIFLILFLFFLGGGTFFYFLLPASDNPSQKIFEIKKGEGIFEIAQRLEKENLIRNRYFFVFLAIIKGSADKIKAGEYYLSSSFSSFKILEIFREGRTVLHKITIPEGWNLKQIADYLDKKQLCSKEEFLEITSPPFDDFLKEFDFLKDKPKDLTLEGYLFPDTYFIEKGTSCQEIVRMFLKNFSQKLTPRLREEIKKQKKSIFEIVTMASMLEKEVKTKEEKEIAAGILWKRLEVGIPLQVDATITYLTGKKTTKISHQDLQIDSPYNTYKYPGLPLGPIANPGMESILSAIYPKKTDYWYYLSTPQGKTLFSKTLMEHRIKKAKYLK